MLSRLMLFLGGVVVVALFSALLAPLFIDWTSLRADFEREASRIVGKPVVVHGSVDARILPFPSVTLNDVRVGEATDGEPLVQVARFSMDAELAPFLSGEALIFDMRLEEPKARVRLQQDGTLDWARGRKSFIPAKTVVLENVQITGGEIEFIDEQTGRTRMITGLEATVAARSLTSTWRMEGRAALDGEAGGFAFTGTPGDDGSLSLKARLMPESRPFGVELDGTMRVVDLKPHYDGAFTLLRNEVEDEETEAAPVRMTGGFELTNERIRVPQYRMELGPASDPYIVTGEATLDTGKVPEFLLTADGQQIDVSRIGGNGNGKAAKTGRDPAISLRQRLTALTAIAADIPIPQVPGRASLLLPAILVGDTTVRDVRLDLRPDGSGWIVDNAVAQLPGRTQLEAKGRVNLKGELAFRGDLLLASNQPSGFASWLAGSVDPAIRTLKTAGFSATVDLTETLQRFENLEVAAGPASLTGRIERESLSGQQPALSMQLNGNSIDLEALKALAGLVAGDASSDTLLSHAIAAEFSAGTFHAFGEEAEGVDAVLSLRDGVLKIDRLSVASLAGAGLQLSGSVSGALPDPSASLRMKLTAEDMASFMGLIGRHAPAHPALRRMVESGHYYSAADLDITLDAGGSGGEGPLTLGVIGQANGSRVTAHYQAQDLSHALAGTGIAAEATLQNPLTTVLLGQAGLDPLPFDVDSDAILSLKLQSDSDAKAEGSLTFSTNQTTIGMRGDVDLKPGSFLEGDIKLSLDSRDFEPYLLMRGLALPQMGTGLPLLFGADVKITPEAVAFSNISGRADQNVFQGRLSLDRASGLSKGTADLAFDTLDLSMLGEGILGPLQNSMTGELSEEPVGTPLLSGIDIEADLAAREFWPGVGGAVSDFKATARWTGEEIVLSEIGGQWLGGTAGGRLSIGNGAGSGLLQGQLTLTDADLEALAWKGAAGKPVAEGKFSLTMAMEASGASALKMAETASGSGRMTIGNFSVRGLNTGALKALMTLADGLEGEITADAVKPLAERLIHSGDASFASADIPFNIVGGTLRAQNVLVADQRASLSAEAVIDPVENAIEAAVTVRYLPGDDALAGADPAVTLSYSGLLGTPGETLDAGELANFLSLRAFERERRRVETLQANVLEKQRLRREAALYRFKAEEREAARLRAEEEDRKRRIAQEEAARRKAAAEAEAAAAAKAAAALKAEQEAARKAAEEAERRAQEEAERRQQQTLPVNPEEGVTREELPPVGGQTLNFDTLPGVNAVQ